MKHTVLKIYNLSLEKVSIILPDKCGEGVDILVLRKSSNHLFA